MPEEPMSLAEIIDDADARIQREAQPEAQTRLVVDVRVVCRHVFEMHGPSTEVAVRDAVARALGVMPEDAQVVAVNATVEERDA